MKNYLYFSHSDSSVLIYLLKTNVLIDQQNSEILEVVGVSIEKQKLQELMVEKFSDFMKEQNLALDNVEAIYMRNIESTWNANRLVCLFAKTISYYKKIPIYVGKIEEEFQFEKKETTNITNNLKTFVNLDNSCNLQPFYNTCPVINT